MGMRLPFCPVACVPTRSPDVPEGVVGRFTPAATSPPVPVLVAVAFCLAAELDGVVSPLLPAPVFGVADDAAVCLGEAVVCLGEAVSLDEAAAAVVRLAFLTGVVGFELRLCGVFLPEEAGDDRLGGVCPEL